MDRFIISICCVAVTLSAVAQVALPRYLNAHMVLQRDVAVPIFGKAAPGERVSVSFGGQTLSTTADATGRWRVSLAPMPANAQSQDLTITCQFDNQTIKQSNNQTILPDILVGDVYFVTGPAARLRTPFRKAKTDEEKALRDSAGVCPQVRYLALTPVATDYPAPRRAYQADFTSARGWHHLVVSEGGRSVVDTSASLLAFSFAKRRTEVDRVPVGLIVLTGSQALEAQMDPAVLRKMPALSGLSAQVDAFLPETEIGAKAYAGYEKAFRDRLDYAARELAAGRELKEPQPTLPKLREAELCGEFNGVIAALRGMTLRGVRYVMGEPPNARDAVRLKYDERCEVVRRSLDGVFGADKTRLCTVEEVAK